ncbi:hepcidin-like [Synchiropus splendidus]|uniref:hepcidin-like n=1 Tax=Synchiropus splendidus TaxID=270530 RepID=UPI00237DDDA8|nr:hepcidin-like [Synchiropus splendidus]
MKNFGIVVCVAVVLVVICRRQSSAAPLTEVEEQQEMMMESPAEEQEQMALHLWEMPHSREKRGIKCRFCCGCCSSGGCGVCCRKRRG